MSNNFSIIYLSITLILVSMSVFYPLMVWVDSFIRDINGGELRIELLNYMYDSNSGFYVFNFKVFNGYGEFINLIDVLINDLSFKGFGENAYFSHFSQFEYDFGMSFDKYYANKLSITILGKSTIYLKLYIPKNAFNNNCMNFIFKFVKGYNNGNILSVKVTTIIR